MVKDTYTVSPAGADPGPRHSYTPLANGVVRLRRSYELCYLPGPGWHNHYPKADRRRLQAPIWVGAAEFAGECVIAVPHGLELTAHTHSNHNHHNTQHNNDNTNHLNAVHVPFSDP